MLAPDVRPVQELKAFQRVPLKAGEARATRPLTITPEMLTILDRTWNGSLSPENSASWWAARLRTSVSRECSRAIINSKGGTTGENTLHVCACDASCSSVVDSAYAQRSATISGIIKDSQTGEALPGANVTLVKTSLGASTDIEGKYAIREVPPGSYTIRATYVGYTEKQVTIQVTEGQILKQDFQLVSVGVEGEEVVVTAQAAGQKEAINQQLASMPVMNVVSAARIQELPDVNAAESVGRLPGVSLIRTGGEGSKVVVRGLSPQYNQITIDGVELSSNVNSQNSVTSGDRNQGTGTISLLGDRGMDLEHDLLQHAGGNRSHQGHYA